MNHTPVITDDAIYECDNGAWLCGKHLGSSAKFTGRDISGQPIHRLTGPELTEVFALLRELDRAHACETCDAIARRAAK